MVKKSDLFRMVVKNISQTRPFFFANIIAIGVGILLVVVMLSVSTAVKNYSRELIREETSALAIEVAVEQYSFDTPPLTGTILKILENIEHVTRAVPLVQGIFAEISYQKGTKAHISLWSTIGETDPELTRLKWKYGDLHSIGAGTTEYLVVSEDTLHDLEIPSSTNVRGQPITLTVTRFKDTRKEHLHINLKIAAVAKRTRFHRCYAPLSLLSRVLKWQNWEIDTIKSINQTSGNNQSNEEDEQMVFESALVYVKKIENVAPVRKVLEEKGYQTASLLDTIKQYEEIAFIITIILGIIGFIALFTGSVSIFNATYASVLRRIKEIGIYKTYGATGPTIFSLILGEIAITALVAGTFGYLLGKFFCKVIQDIFLINTPLDLTQTSFGLFLFVEVLALAICILAGIKPALKGARLNPIEAIRHE